MHSVSILTDDGLQIMHIFDLRPARGVCVDYFLILCRIFQINNNTELVANGASSSSSYISKKKTSFSESVDGEAH